MITAQTRIFKYKDRTLTDPAPGLPVAQAIKAYQDQYPEMVNCTIGEPVLDTEKSTVTYAITSRTGTAG